MKLCIRNKPSHVSTDSTEGMGTFEGPSSAWLLMGALLAGGASSSGSLVLNESRSWSQMWVEAHDPHLWYKTGGRSNGILKGKAVGGE